MVNLAPSGRVSSRVFVEMLEDLTALTAGEEILPDQWMDLNVGQLEALAQQVICIANTIGQLEALAI